MSGFVSTPVVFPSWTRIANGHYTWADYAIRREPTPRGTTKWFVYRDDKKIALRATLGEAKAFVERNSARRQLGLA